MLIITKKQAGGQLKKIAVISNTFPPFSGGGVATAQFNLFNKLKEAGYEVKGFTFFDHGKIKLKENDIIRCGAPKTIFRTVNTILKNYFSRKKNSGYAWQYAFSVNSAIGCMKINAALKKFAPDVVIMPDLGTPNYFIKRPHKSCKMVFVSHHNALRFLGNPLIEKHSEEDAKLVNNLENNGMKNIDKVICPSEYMKQVFEETHDFNGEVTVIPNFVNENLIKSFSELNPREEMGLVEDTPVIYIPLANTPVKGSRYMFEIIRRLGTFYQKPLGFYLSGGMTEELAFELKHVPNNIKIYSPGFLEYEKNIGVIKSCDFGITPTLLESFGMAILEANFCGLPFVSFNTGGNKDITTDDENGYIVDYLDIENLIEKSKLLLSDETLRKSMSIKTLENASKNFSSDKTLNSLADFIFR